MTGGFAKTSSRITTRNDKQAELIDLLSCPICLEIMGSPIYQCPNGHALCSFCKPQMQNQLCPTCRAENLDIRALPLEKLAACLDLPLTPCRYSSKGCAEVIRVDLKRQHEEACQFRIYQCPNVGWCDFTGTVAELVPHLQDDHACVTSHTSDDNVPYVYQHDTPVLWNSHVFICLGEHFLLNVEGFESPGDLVYTAFMTFMGPPSQASKFRYKVEVGDDAQWMTWEGVPKSIQDSRELLKQKMEGLIIHHSLMRRYDESTDPDNFMVLAKVSIWRAAGAEDQT